MDTTQSACQIGQEHQPPAAQDPIEGLFRQIEGFGIHLPELDVRQAQGRCPVSRNCQHLLRLVRPGNAACGTDSAGCGEAGLADAGGHVKHMVSRLDVSQLH